MRGLCPTLGTPSADDAWSPVAERSHRYGAVVTSDLLQAVASFETAVGDRSGQDASEALDQIRGAFSQATKEEVVAAGPRLSAVLPDVPAGPAGIVAVVIGACVEGGAEPMACAIPVLEGAETAVAAALEFCNRWALSEDDEYPEPTMGDAPPEVIDRIGGSEDPTAVSAVSGWWTLPQWEQASIAVLSHKEVRLAVLPRPDLDERARSLAAASGAGQFLLAALQVLDDERMVVIHRPSGKGFEFTIGGIADNFQLHTLLAAELVIPGHVPGTPPTELAVAACRGATSTAPTGYESTGSFNLVAPDGTWIWNEGTPGDIPLLGDTRLLVLDPPPYERMWSAGRLFPSMTAQLELERILSPDDVSRYMQHVKSPVLLSPGRPTKPSRRRRWRLGR